MKKQSVLSRIISAGLAMLFLLSVPVTFTACNNEEELPIMPIVYVQGLADHGRDTVLADILKYRYTEYNSEIYILFEFELDDARFKFWAGYSPESGLIEYLCLTHLQSRTNLYLFHRGNETLEDGTRKYGEDASADDVAAFIEECLAEQ